MTGRAIVQLLMKVENIYWRMTLLQRLELYKYFKHNYSVLLQGF